MSLDEIYDIVSYAYAKGKLKYALPMLLARYGINGEELLWMRNLKFSHIDFENKVVNIFNVETGEEHIYKYDKSRRTIRFTYKLFRTSCTIP